MVSLRKFLNGSVVLLAALFLVSEGANANALYNGSMSVSGSDPTQVGRLNRQGTPQDWSGGAPSPLVTNPGTSYHYSTLTLDVTALEAPFGAYGGYLEISVDSPGSATFFSAYLDSYNPNSLLTNWLGDPGSSGLYFGVDTLYFQIFVPEGHDLVLVLNETVTNAGLNQIANFTIDAFADTNYTEIAPASTVPEPATLLLVVVCLAAIASKRKVPARVEAPLALV